MIADRARQPRVLRVPPPEIVDADDVDVDPHLVHDGDALFDPGTLDPFFEGRALDDACRNRHVPMAMDIDHAHATATDHGLAACWCLKSGGGERMSRDIHSRRRA